VVVRLYRGPFLIILILFLLGTNVCGNALMPCLYIVRNNWRVVVRLYRGPFLIILFLFLLGINVYGWRSSGVNHVLIFELDPR
jgi:hypothetical protein